MNEGGASRAALASDPPAAPCPRELPYSTTAPLPSSRRR